MSLSLTPLATLRRTLFFAKKKPLSSSRAQVGFTLVELLVTTTILFALAAAITPVISAMMRDMRANNAIARLKVGMQQTRVLLADYPIADLDAASPSIPNGRFTGTALVVRWDDYKQEYEVFYALGNQTAKNPGQVGVVDATYLTTHPGTTNPKGYLATAGKYGYARLNTLEAMALETGIRVAGLRRRNASASGFELVPGSSFAICMDITGVGIPPTDRVYVNLQEAPPSAGTGTWSVWDTTMYDDVGSNTGAYNATYDENGGTGEGFYTSLPWVIVYRDDDLPLSGKSPSGTDWRIQNAGGVMALNPALDPNELLAQTRGRLVLLTMQGGSPAEY